MLFDFTKPRIIIEDTSPTDDHARVTESSADDKSMGDTKDRHISIITSHTSLHLECCGQEQISETHEPTDAGHKSPDLQTPREVDAS